MTSTLPNAPLVEVVFELRWELLGRPLIPSGPKNLRTDPGYPYLVKRFPGAAKKLGYTRRSELNADQPIGPIGYAVQHRFHKSGDDLLPLFQIGPGIWTCNDSSDYEWDSFRGEVGKGLKALFASYETTTDIDIYPTQIELRYINAFNPELLNHQDLTRFLGLNTNIVLDPTDFLKSNRFRGEAQGQIRLSRKVTGLKNTSFQLEVGTGSHQNEPSIIVIIKVVWKADRIRLGRTPTVRSKAVIAWANEAHAITHEFFEGLMSDDLMAIFRNSE